MCGIAGLVQWRAVPVGSEPLQARAAAMGDAVLHRGPDDAGIWTDPAAAAGRAHCTLAHRRLSVIDPASGHQPLANEDQTVWTVFNGEIYNFAELRSGLESQGHRFRTQTDSEVLVHLWEQHGPEMVGLLRGMFAFAIWDSRSQTLFAAVDPLGKKPFYYTTDDGVLRFGSELKCLLVGETARRPEVDADAVLLYLSLGYIPAPWTVLRGVRKLPPGHRLVASADGSRVEPYWRVPRRPPPFAGSRSDAEHELRERLTSAVRRRLVADVPLGAFLSGGIDSTIVVGLMSRLSPEPVKTFTIAFDEARFDESRYARLVAQRFGTDHHELRVTANAVDVLPVIARHFDEPFGDSSAIPTYYVSKLTRKHVTVALTGDGGDETFGGYRRYRRGKLAGWLRKVPAGRSVAAAAGRLIPAGVDRTTDFGRARRVLTGLTAKASEAYLEQMLTFSRPTLASLVTPELMAAGDPDLPGRWFASLYEGTDPADPAAADMAADLQSYLPGDILTKVDRASMAVALECRSPFLDVDLVEFACSLPTSWRLRGLAGHKHILRSTFADVLPSEVVNRRKSGFAIPLPQWFRGALRPLLRDTLLSRAARSRGWVRPDAVERLIEAHEAGTNHASALWTLLMLEMWHQTWLP